MGIKVYYISKQGRFQYKSAFSKHLWGESSGGRERDALLQTQSVSLGDHLILMCQRQAPLLGPSGRGNETDNGYY
jgi:hypothetical protein